MAFGGQEKATILSVDGQWLKLVILSGSPNNRAVKFLVSIPIQHLKHEAIIEKLKQECQDKGIQVDSVLVANPSRLTTARLFTLPSTDVEEIRDIVHLQAEKHTPYAKEEIVTDFKIIDTQPGGISRVMMVISHQDVIHRALRIAQDMGWTLDRVGFELEGTVNAFLYAQEKLAKSKTPFLLADINDEYTDLIVVHQGMPYFHRTVNIGCNHLIQVPESSSRFCGEVRRSIEAFEADDLGLAPEQVFLTGVVSQMQPNARQIGELLGVPTQVVDPYDGWKLSKELVTAVAQETISFQSLMGMGTGAHDIDLTPKSLKLHRTFEVRARTLVALGCQFMAVLLMMTCWLVGKAYQEEKYLDQLVLAQQETSRQADQLELTLKQLELINGWMRNRGRLLDAFVELNRVQPDSLTWDNFSYTRGEEIVMKGVSAELPKVFDYVAAIEGLSVCHQPEAGRVSKRKEGEDFVTEFSIGCQLGNNEIEEAS